MESINEGHSIRFKTMSSYFIVRFSDNPLSNHFFVCLIPTISSQQLLRSRSIVFLIKKKGYPSLGNKKASSRLCQKRTFLQKNIHSAVSILLTRNRVPLRALCTPKRSMNLYLRMAQQNEENRGIIIERSVLIPLQLHPHSAETQSRRAPFRDCP